MILCLINVPFLWGGSIMDQNFQFRKLGGNHVDIVLDNYDELMR